MQIYKETHFDILGPDIYVPRHGDHQSPMFKNLLVYLNWKMKLKSINIIRKTLLNFQDV